jgi:hypothetical protein
VVYFRVGFRVEEAVQRFYGCFGFRCGESGEVRGMDGVIEDVGQGDFEGEHGISRQ